MMTHFSVLAILASLCSTTMAQQFVMYTPGGDDTAVERMDAILSPGVVSGHVHQIFGNGGMSPSSTYASLNGNKTCTTVGDASGNGNAQDGSIYWHPALYMQAKDGSGYIRVPTNGHKLYYKNAGSTKDTLRSPFEFPAGFRMIAGNMFNRTASSDIHAQNITQWICHVKSGPSNQGTAGGFPTGVTDCENVDGFNGAIHFPHCWNGNDYNPLAPDAHMSYPNGDIENGICPSSHPIRLPHIFAENTFDLHSVVDKVVPDTFTLAQGDPTGYGWHFDFYNGWDSGAIPNLLNTCPQGKYSNEDVGTCSEFVKSKVPMDECSLQTTFKENLDTPGQYLPGCNPVTTESPAPLYVTAALGISTIICNIINLGSTLTSGGTAGNVNSAAAVASSATAPASTASPTSLSLSTSTSTSTSIYVPAAAAAASPSSSTSSNTLSCPASNGTTYTASTGAQFLIECGIDHDAGDLAMVFARDLTSCTEACAAHTGCVDVSLSGVACYMKSSVGATLEDDGVLGARLISGVAASSGSAAAPAVTKAALSTSNDEVANAAQDVQVVWVTETVTVTAPSPAATAGLKHRHARRHRHGAVF